MSNSNEVLKVQVSEERLPAFDPSHGTPDPMVRRTLVLERGAARAQFEQTDYGHPGRFNDWDPRGIDSRLQPHTDDLRAICRLLTRLLQ